MIRRLPLLWTDGTNLYPTLSIESLRIALGMPTLVVMGETDGPGFVEGVRIGPLSVPTTPQRRSLALASQPGPGALRLGRRHPRRQTIAHIRRRQSPATSS